jgi:microcystin-dependent protein
MGTFDPTKGYKRIWYREDRDLLDGELNEAQEIAIHERTALMGRLFAPGSILTGLAGTVNGDAVTLAAGTVYLDGHAVSVPGAVLQCAGTGVHTIWLDVFRRIVTMADDPALVNPLTGEPTAEREKWIATLQTRDTSGDPLPDGAVGRSTVALFTFHRDTGVLVPVVTRVVEPTDPAWLASHIGHGGTAQHPAATNTEAGFLAATDKAKLDQLSPTTPPAHAHDDRYAPLAHVGAGGAVHTAVSTEQAGFMSAADKTKLDGLPNAIPSQFVTGMILLYTGAVAPSGWAICNGSNGTPDLRDRFVIGAGASYPLGATGGEAAHGLSESEMPSHTHAVGSHVHALNTHTHISPAHSHSLSQTTYEFRDVGTGSVSRLVGSDVWANASTTGTAVTINEGGGGNTQAAGADQTTSAGMGTPHNNLPPYYALCYIMKL